MSFAGWQGDFVRFFRGLEMDNSKSYFEKHRALYERDVRGPMSALVEELEPLLGPSKIFRINRDIRFSADKSPYKTNIAATAGALYIHLDARMLFLGTGSYHPEREWLAGFREAVAGPAGEEFARIVEAARDCGLECGVDGAALKTVPRGYPADHERIDYLRWRNAVAGRRFEIEPWIATPEAKDRILKTWECMQPFSGWLKANVRSSQQPA
jgi:uncharacterized protein (TIGR02453 family)